MAEASEAKTAGGKKQRDLGRAAAVRRESEVSRWDAEADVIVVGLGSAGACAAIEAADAGAQVLVLERFSGGGGTTALSTGLIYLGGGTPVQKACGFEDTPEEMYKYLMAASGPGEDEAKIRLFCDQSVEHFHWLVKQGVPFKESYYDGGSYTPTDDCLSYSGSELAYPYKDIAKPAPRGHTAQHAGIEAGGLLMQKLIPAVSRAGAHIQCDTLVETLIRNDAGRVVGVVAKHERAERCYRARRGVVLCAGGFINNREMVRRHAPLLAKCKYRLACDGDDGRGIRMGMGAGGAAIRMDAGSIVLPFTVPKGLIRGILVNRQGARFIAEDVYQTVVGEAALLHQGGEVFLIVDDAIFERPFAPTEIAAVSDSIAGLEAELKFPPGSLQSTLAMYNEHAARGEDPVFHKQPDFLVPLLQPPFAALDFTTQKAWYSVFTLGGLFTSIHGQVLTPDAEPVPGLYAAGRTTSGLAAQGYSSGLSIADGTFFGRQAGRHAAGND
jgi:3-oxo-5alpha-steroid 4-dehydrogenase